MTDRAVRLAGALAEAGVTRLTLVRSGGSIQALTSGNTDLPGLLTGLGGALAELRAADAQGGSIVVRIEPTEWTWSGSGRLAELFRARWSAGARG